MSKAYQQLDQSRHFFYRFLRIYRVCLVSFTFGLKIRNDTIFRKYRKNSKNWDTIMLIVNVVKVEQYGFTPK